MERVALRWGLLAADAKRTGRSLSTIERLAAGNCALPRSYNRFAQCERLHEHTCKGSFGTRDLWDQLSVLHIPNC